MTVAMLLDNPTGSQEIYNKTRESIDLPAGGIMHVAGPAPGGGWRVIELWESQEAAQQFLRERLAPALAAAGASAPTQAEFWPVRERSDVTLPI